MPTCTSCGAEAPATAQFCPACGSKIEDAPAVGASPAPPAAQPEAPSTPSSTFREWSSAGRRPPGKPLDPDKAKKRSNLRNWWIAAGVIAGVILIVGLAMGPEDEDSDPSGEDLEFGAYDVCQQFVEDQLKAPGTADFPDFFGDEVIVSASGDTYVVTSHVDAENSFGASLRTPFTCTVTHVGGNEFQLADLQLVE